MSKKIAEILQAHGVEVSDETLQAIETEHKENFRSIEETKNKDEKIKAKDAEIESLNGQLKELNDKAAALEGSGEELEALKTQLAELQAEADKRKADEKEAAKRASFEEVFNTAVGDRQFVNSMTRDAIFSAAYDASGQQVGVSAADLITQLTDGKEGIWANPQTDPKKMPDPSTVKGEQNAQEKSDTRMLLNFMTGRN